jgi:saccharopine dehydrogenase (NAD+, L-lysine-forming)
MRQGKGHGMKTIVILGGYGNTGREVARLLLEHSDVRVALAGRSAERVMQAAANWNRRFPGGRVSGLAADASDAGSLKRAFNGADLVIVASSTSEHADVVAGAALEAGLDYMDPHYSASKVKSLQALAPAIESAGRCFITDAGFHPGLPAALVRLAAQRLSALRSARVASVIQIDWASLDFSPATLDELVSEFREYKAMHFVDGRWKSMSFLQMMLPVWFRFDHGFGRRYAMPMFLEEMRPLPDLIPTLRETGFYVGGFNWFVDWIIFPLGLGLLWLPPARGQRLFSRMMLWGLKRFGRPPYGTLLQLEAEGIRNGTDVELVIVVYHADGYVLTAAPMVATLLQVLDGSARKPGLHFQALLADPERLLVDMQRMGVEVTISEGKPG